MFAIARRSMMAAWIVWGVVALIPQIANAQELDAVFAARQEASTVKVDHATWDGFLKTYVVPGADGLNRVRYGKVTPADRAGLDTYLDRLQAVDVTALSGREQRAFWSNFYNALTIKVVLDHYPVKSIRDITFGFLSFGPWNKKFLKVGGRELSLDDIEHKILRKLWRDPLNHYAVNCASVGCPNLQTFAFTGANIDKALKDAARAYINSPRGVAVSADGRIKGSNIYSWFQEDFGGTEAGVIAHWKDYANAPLAAQLADATRIAAFDYDWTLNEAK